MFEISVKLTNEKEEIKCMVDSRQKAKDVCIKAVSDGFYHTIEDIMVFYPPKRIEKIYVKEVKVVKETK